MVKRAANDRKENASKRTKSTFKKEEEVPSKRKAPITSAAPANEEDSEEDEGYEEVPNESDVEEEVEPSDNNDKAASNKKVHAEQKEKAALRKAQKPHSELVARAKIHWEKVRQNKSMTREERQQHLDPLMEVVTGHVKDVIFKHDASRIIQSIVKWGSRKEREIVAQELEGTYLQLAQDKYANFLLTKLIRYCPTHRSKILASFHGHVPRLLLHKYASGVIEDAFALYANAEDRQALVRDFYGKEFALFNDDESKKGKVLKDLLANESQSKREMMMDNVRNTLQSIFEHSDKGAVSHSIVHRALWEYMSSLEFVYGEVEADKKRKSLLEDCDELLPEIVHTRDGSRAAREFIATLTAKERKVILRTIKPHIEKMATDDQAQFVLFTVLDAVDDTKALSQSVIAPMTKAAEELAFDKNGRRSLHYLTTPRSTKHFTPAFIATIAETDESLKKTSKKDANIRRTEIQKASSADLLKIVEEIPRKLIMDAGGSLILSDIMLYTVGDKCKALDALAGLIETSSDVLDFAPASRVYKTILQGGKFDKNTKKVEVSDPEMAKQAAEKIWKALQAHAVKLAKTSGTFILAELAETAAVHNLSAIKEELLNEFDSPQREEIKNSDAKGNTLLLEKLDKLKVTPIEASSMTSMLKEKEEPRYFAGLNTAQLEGKTRVLTTRIAHMILHHNILPNNIVAVTFTNKAANEMKTRLRSLIEPSKVESLVMGTFHSVCLRYIRLYGKHMDPPMPKDWSIIDAGDAKDLVSQVCKADEKLKGMADYCRNQISWYKSKRIDPDDLRDMAEVETDFGKKKSKLQLVGVYEQYQKKLKSINCLDFDDILLEGCRVFEQVPYAKNNIQVMLVDEFQDTNTVQYQLMTLMAHTGYVSIVGDPDQSIYGWRAAEIGNLSRMKRDFKDTTEIFLEQNYRSSGAIVKAAMTVMSQDKSRPQKSLQTDHPDGSPVTLKRFEDGEDEAYWIAKEIKRMIAHSGNKLRFEDFVILLRFNALSRTVESELNKMRIPVRVLAGTKFFDRAEIKDIMSYLALLVNPSHSPALRRAINTPKRGMGPKSVDEVTNIGEKAGVPPFTMLHDGLVKDEKVKGWKTSWKKLASFVDPLNEARESLYKGKGLSQIVDRLINDIQYKEHLGTSCKNKSEFESRVENLKELLSFAATIDRDFEDGTLFKEDEEFDSVKDQNYARIGKFMEISSLDVSFNTENDIDEALGKVTISTIHSAKGLEWPVVFLPAVESGIIPFYKSETDEQEREERRLLYVGMTRAKATLNITHAENRMVAGSMKYRAVSDFLRNVLNFDCFQDEAMLIDKGLREQIFSILGLENVDEKELAEAIQEYNKMFKYDQKDFRSGGYTSTSVRDYRTKYRSEERLNPSFEVKNAGMVLPSLNKVSKSSTGFTAGYKNKPFVAPRPANPQVKAEVATSSNVLNSYSSDSTGMSKASDSKRTANLQTFQDDANSWKDSLKVLLPVSSDNESDVKPVKKKKKNS
ncbi:ARM repeat-containing protein [Wallemia mellicola]|uniref:DNA 3'-5' helicase n=2 Tax=Wallemia mellicola TaxID=1708541 RepID=A0AB38MXE0_9BASI|nr:ARM repeat-containing protein [Wallemia mellicola]TIC68392.1 ARM repeat-containing protein [Wallemia mellicola]TIC69317.1 ARM repeat-containing protein [Wallemia mellicola]